MLTTYIIVAAIAYLLGSIPFGYILVRVFRGEDVRAIGSGNIGATNVGRTGHKGLAVATLLLDAGKGAAAVAIASYVAHQTWHPYAYEAPVAGWYLFRYTSMAALLAIVGHVFPLWLGFKGGKGVATAVGAFAGVAPLAVAIVFALFVIIVAVTRYVSLGSIIAATLFPVLVIVLKFPSAHFFDWAEGFAMICVAALLVIARHHENIRRLLSGTENKLGAKSKLAPPQQMESRP